MERFFNNIESQTIELSVLDTQGSFANIPFVFFYENSANEPGFMDSDLLRESFYRTVAQAPTLVGYIRSKGRGRTRVVIDAGNLNMPDYRESSSSIHFDSIKSDGFNWRSWPLGVSTVGPMSRAGADGEIKPINAHVIHLKDNSGAMVYVSMTHYITDCFGYVAVVKRWGKIYQLLLEGDSEKINDLPPLIVDRNVFLQSLPKERSPLNKVTREVFSKPSLLSEFFAWISPKTRGYISSKIVQKQNAETHIFHISFSTLDSLRRSVREHVADVFKVTDSNIIMALTTKTIVQAQRAANKRVQGPKSLLNLLGSEKDDVPLAVIFEVRNMLGIDNVKYVGNALIPRIQLVPVADLLTPTTFETLSQTITLFSDIAADLSPSYIASYADMVVPRPSSFTRPMARFVRRKDGLSYIYDPNPDMYVVNFGTGRPSWVSPLQPFRANLTQMLTSKDPDEGVDVFMSLYPGVMREVLENEFWKKTASLIY